MSDDCVRALFIERMRGFEAGIVEGNRGLFDGMDSEGSMSTASLARCLEAPLVLVVDATKMTRTAAAIIQGVAGFEPGLNLAGVILNRTAGPRHRKILRESIERYTSIPVLGTPAENSGKPHSRASHGAVVEQGDGYHRHSRPIGRSDGRQPGPGRNMEYRRPRAPPWSRSATPCGPEARGMGETVIGVVRDEAFWFYYPENIEALERAGAVIKKRFPSGRRTVAGAGRPVHRRRFSGNPGRAAIRQQRGQAACFGIIPGRLAHLRGMRRFHVSGQVS